MKNIFIRLKMAWKVFWLIPFEIQYKPFHYYCDLRKNSNAICDNENADKFGDKIHKCQKNANIALAETIVKFTVEERNFYHVCGDCGEKFNLSKSKYQISK
jgi:hypothetical protein